VALSAALKKTIIPVMVDKIPWPVTGPMGPILSGNNSTSFDDGSSSTGAQIFYCCSHVWFWALGKLYVSMTGDRFRDGLETVLSRVRAHVEQVDASPESVT
jgi:hypothetical protein